MTRTHKRVGPRGQVISLRANRRQRATIDRSALMGGQRRSEFILEAATRAAQEILLDCVLLRVDLESFDRFAALLDGPPPTDALRDLLTRPTPRE